jgi:hypothetical protein
MSKLTPTIETIKSLVQYIDARDLTECLEDLLQLVRGYESYQEKYIRAAVESWNLNNEDLITYEDHINNTPAFKKVSSAFYDNRYLETVDFSNKQDLLSLLYEYLNHDFTEKDLKECRYYLNKKDIVNKESLFKYIIVQLNSYLYYSA